MSNDKSGGNAITRYLRKAGYTPLDDEQYSRIDRWKRWYKGFDKDFHEYTISDSSTTRTFKRYTLGMAKTVCEDFATLLLNEKVQINADNFKPLPDILRDNSFIDRANRLLELTFALGTGALVEFNDADGNPTIDYIRGDLIYPLTWDGDKITECAFGSVRTYKEGGKNKKGFYLQLHTRDEQKQYTIRNVYLDEAGNEIAAPEGVEPESNPSPLPLFQIMRPNIVNNYDLDSPMGMSVYGSAIDQLKGCDLVYDSYINEFVLGKKRLLVPMSMTRLTLQTDGTYRPMFDPKDTLFYVYQQDDDVKNEIKPIDLVLRVDDHEKGLQRMIDTLSKRCGLGNGRYHFDNGIQKTATEVISEDSDLYQSIRRHEKPLERAIIGMVRALSWLMGGSPDIDVNVEFDDSIFEDTGTTIERNIKLVAAGMKSKKAAIMEIAHCDEKEAEKRLLEIAKEQTIEEPNVATMFDRGEAPPGGVE